MEKKSGLEMLLEEIKKEQEDLMKHSREIFRKLKSKTIAIYNAKTKMIEKEIREEVEKQIRIESQIKLSDKWKEIQKEELDFERTLLTDFEKEFHELIMKQKNSQLYRDFFAKKLESVQKIYTETFVIHTSEEDYEFFRKIIPEEWEIKKGNYIDGGFIVETMDCRFRLDNSLDTIFKEFSKTIEIELKRVLQSE
ncbi:MAG: hypothetical protein JXA60_10780 [Candidatus Coatesbacteria bacterium]|nr:hypothetical protein [Candidatus Coatesbacteria bacterium]